jgi:hypothetical protein
MLPPALPPPSLEHTTLSFFVTSPSDLACPGLSVAFWDARSSLETKMLCVTCLGVLEECRNLILEESSRCSIDETIAGKGIFRQGTIDATAPKSGHEKTALLENATSHHIGAADKECHVGTTPDFCATSSDEGKLAQHDTSNTQKVSAIQSERDADTSHSERYAIYGHHTALANLKAAARSGCQICWQVWDLLSSDKFKIAADGSEAHEAVDPANTQFCTCLLLNSGDCYEFGIGSFIADIFYDGTDSPQGVCRFTLYPRNRMYKTSSDCNSC